MKFYMITGLQIGLVGFGMSGIAALATMDVSVLLDKAPELAAMIAVVWILTKRGEDQSKAFQETIKQMQNDFKSAAMDCHAIQRESVKADREMTVAITKLESAAIKEVEAMGRLERVLTEAVVSKK